MRESTFAVQHDCNFGHGRARVLAGPGGVFAPRAFRRVSGRSQVVGGGRRVREGVTAGAWNGVRIADWNLWATALSDALGIADLVGELVAAQGWMRDSSASKASSLSNALELVVFP